MAMLIAIWLRIGLVIYWIVWLGGEALFGGGCWKWVIWGVISWVIWAIITQILFLINKDGWFWEMF